MSFINKIADAINEYLAETETEKRRIHHVGITFPDRNTELWIMDSEMWLLGPIGEVGKSIIRVSVDSQMRKSKRVRQEIEAYNLFMDYTHFLDGRRSVYYKAVDREPSISNQIIDIIQKLYPDAMQDLTTVHVHRLDNWMQIE